MRIDFSGLMNLVSGLWQDCPRTRCIRMRNYPKAINNDNRGDIGDFAKKNGDRLEFRDKRCAGSPRCVEFRRRYLRGLEQASGSGRLQRGNFRPACGRPLHESVPAPFRSVTPDELFGCPWRIRGTSPVKPSWSKRCSSPEVISPYHLE
jgi:hypothetical protein